MEPAPPLDDLMAQYLSRHTASGRSAKPISRYQNSINVFYGFLEEHGVATNRRALNVAPFRQCAAWPRAIPVQRTRRGQRKRSEDDMHGIL